MLMRKKILKILILLIFALSINKYSLNIFADTSKVKTSTIKNDSTILDGEIGEWDPELDDNPDFDGFEIEGNKPENGDYDTISVTVPVNMEFYVLPNTRLPDGSFYSPMYTIKNNGSKNISVSIDSFERDGETLDSDTVPLYIESLTAYDNKTQMELKLCGVEDLSTTQVNKKVDLWRLGELTQEEKKLYSLSANETKGIKFHSERWELPERECNKKKAMSNFTASFIFSINR